ncbi:MAG: putative Ig domain-containing protein, partial [Roseovarius sp.]|nr:putative Ig domain-containing protein [Roseovarius sp.]
AAQTTASFDIVVRPGNSAPVVATPLPLEVREGDPLRIAITAADPEGGALRYSAPVLPAGAAINPETGVLEWTPGYTQMGNYEVPVDVTDGTRTTRVVLRINVANANGAPVIQGFDDWTITEGQALFFRTAALDPDNPDYILPERDPDGALLHYEGSQRESVSYTLTGLPDGASYDAGTGQFIWQTGFADAGRYVMRLTATDDGDGTGVAASRSIDITINVEDLNRPPELPDLPNRTVAGGEVIEIPLTSVDPDGNLLRFEATATRAAGADQLDLDPTPIPLDGSSPFGQLVTSAGGEVTLRLTPQELDRGDWRIDLRGEDDGNGTAANAQRAEGSFVLTVEASNLGPVLAPVGGLVAVPGQQLEYEFTATDADRDPLTFNIAGLPEGAVLSAGNGYGRAVLRWTPTEADIGAHTLTLNVTDTGAGVPGNALNDTLVIPVTVRAVNGGPILQPIGDLTVAELDTLTQTISAADPEGDPLTFSATGLPVGAEIDPLTGVITFTPHSFQSGVYEDIVITASDGHTAATETIKLTVTNTNRAPIFVQTPPQTGREGAEFGFRLLAGDIDGDGVVFEPVGALPRGATLDPITGEFRWTPDYAQAGDYTIKVRVRDAAGADSEQDVSVKVLNRNRAPVLNLQNRAVVLGETLELHVGATDPDADDVLTLAAENLPDTASFDPATGILTFRPELGDLGDNVVRITAFDGTDTVSRNMVLRVTREAQLPTAVLDVTPRFPARPGQTVTLSVAGSGFVPVVSYRLTIDGQEVALSDLNRASFVPDAPGRVTAVLEVTDADGRVGTTTKVIAVRDATDRDAPDLALDIADGAVLSAGPVIGSVLDPSLANWRAILVPASGPAILLGEGDGPVTDGPVGQLDPGLVQSGFYTLRLEAVDVAGLASVLERKVEVLPSASATLRRAEVDATVELGGATLDLTRIYDARDAGKFGDFGAGWSAGWTDLALDAGPASGQHRALREGDRVHLTAPDGTRLVFTAEFETQRIAGLDRAILRFTSPTAGYTLSHDGPLLTESEGGLYSVVSGLPYTPFGRGGEVLTLELPDGTVWHADGSGSVKAVETGGVRLIIADSGII